MKRKILNALVMIVVLGVFRYSVKGIVWILNNYILNPKISIGVFEEGCVCGAFGLLIFAWMDSILNQKR